MLYWTCTRNFLLSYVIMTACSKNGCRIPITNTQSDTIFRLNGPRLLCTHQFRRTFLMALAVQRASTLAMLSKNLMAHRNQPTRMFYLSGNTHNTTEDPRSR